jgi:hypothetical protein
MCTYALGSLHQRLQLAVDDERCNGVDGMHLDDLDGCHLIHLHGPRILAAKIDEVEQWRA